MRPVQCWLFERIREERGQEALAPWVGRILCVGRSAAYRKIKGESGLEIDEAFKLLRALDHPEVEAVVPRDQVPVSPSSDSRQNPP
ncbi:hypothetical protein GC167_08975 [bacterium]|nr:hypothetical protein [bacterium]